jgi:hypothetical protein
LIFLDPNVRGEASSGVVHRCFMFEETTIFVELPKMGMFERN